MKRFFRIFCPLLIVVALVVWCSMRWHVWFHNAPEQPYSALSEPGRVLLLLDSEPDSRWITWQCDSVVHPSWVELAQVPEGDTLRYMADGEVFMSRSGRAAYYRCLLEKLQPEARYAYRVVTAGKKSDWFYFQMPSKRPDAIAFLYIGDVQDTIQGQTNLMLCQAYERHPECEFTICGGDLVERPTDSYWAEAFRGLDSVGQCKPLLTVTGNHDYFKGVIQRIERRFDLVFPYFRTTSTDDNRVFTFHYGSVDFFLLDSNRRPHRLWQQRRWLKQQLIESQARWKIVVLHHPLYSLKGNNNLIQRWMFDDLVRRYGVDLVLQGHEHAYARMTGRDNHGQLTTPVYTVSHCSPKNYRIQFSSRFDRFGISSRYYQVVEASDTVLTLSAYDANHHQLYDSLRIVKSVSSAQPDIDDCARQMPENLHYEPRPGNKKDERFWQRIQQRRQILPKD